MKVFTQLAQLVWTLPAQAATAPAAALEPATPAATANKPLKGRFVHLTDLHPDPFYRTTGAESKACHFKKKKKNKHHRGKGGSVQQWQEGEVVDDEDGDDLDDDDDDDDENDDDEEEGVSIARKGKGKGKRKKKKRRKARKAGYWGLPVSECDSPLTLVNATFDWLGEHFRDEVDFVVWTGDNARHDIDTRLPRTLPEILDLNRYVADRIRETFGKDVPVVASIGNNDIYPHNVLAPGPNKITNDYLDVWSHFIPEHFQHTFARGGYYSVEAVKGDLLLVSLNTLYFYDRNAIVDGCPPADDEFLLRRRPRAQSQPHLDPTLSPTSPLAAQLFNEHIARLQRRPNEHDDDDDVEGEKSFSEDGQRRRPTTTAAPRNIDPGTEQLLWLEQQLTLARAQGMQVWLTGHVPATKDNWYPRCYEQYAELVLGWQDTIVGQLFGHMNVDFVSFISDADAPSSSSSLASHDRLASAAAAEDDQGTIRPLANDLAILNGLEKMYSSLPPEHKLEERDYAPVHVNPSVIPTYLPSVRVWEYNTTRSARGEAIARSRSEQDYAGFDASDPEPGFFARWMPSFFFPRQPATVFHSERQRQEQQSRPDRHSSPHAPGRTNTYLTPLAYTQYHIPRHELERANKAARQLLRQGYASSSSPEEVEPPRWSVEYTTLSTSEAANRLLATTPSNANRGGERAPPSRHADPVLKPALLPPPLQNLLAAPPSAAKFHRVRRMLHKLDLTPYNGVISAREGLTIGAWIKMARWVSEDGQEDRWKSFRRRMGVGSGEL